MVRRTCNSWFSTLTTPKVHIHVLLQGEDQALSVTNAIARSFPLFTAKTPAPASRNVSVSLSAASEGRTTPLSEEIHSSLSTFADAIRQTARLVDTPTSELNTTALVKEIQAVADAFPETVQAEIISGEALLPAGLRALHGVGRAATAPPALASLSYTPAGSSSPKAKVALVGKGIVYDTGGLSLKSGANMCEMKSDMGGCAALLQAFRVLVESKCPIPVVFVGCIAENAIGPLAQRPDDIVVAHSGKTIELNNTDAEGRLVLADGVSWVAQTHEPTHIVDMATLTGAQMITTGMHHAAVLSSSPSLEATLLAAGQQSGDWAFPMIYAPEILMSEFDSKVADMKNSVKSRLNAQSSCAGHFIESHLPEAWKGEWAHVDIAGPSLRDGRATGYGVGMIVEAVRTLAKGHDQ
jgi:probable aminopeptidase NPEPL1